MKKKLLLKSMLLLCALVVGSSSVWAQSDYSTVYSSNVTLNATGGTKATASTVVINGDEYNAMKLGSSGNSGNFKVTFPSGTKYIHLHVAAWSGKNSNTLSFSGISNYSPSSAITLTANTGVSGSSSTYTFATSGSNSAPNSANHYKVITLSTALASNTEVTIACSERCVIWGVNSETMATGTTEAPTITGETPFIGTTTVTISNAASAEGADIYYTLNGDEPTTTESSTCFAYSDPFIIDATTTVKAIAKKASDTNASTVVSKTFTKLSTVTYNLVTSIVPGKHYIIIGGNKAMGSQGSNNRAAVDVSVVNNSVTFVQGEVCEFIIYGPDASGRYSIYDETDEGYLYAASSSNNYLRTQTPNNDNGKWTITFDGGTNSASIVANGSNTRKVMQYNSQNSIFACYASANQGAVYLYEKKGEVAPTTVDVTLAASDYASYCSPFALNLAFTTTDYAAYAVTATSGTTVTFNKISDAVPAETPFILYGEDKGGTTIHLSIATGETTEVSSNMLVGTLAPTYIETVTGDYTNFGLSNGTFVKINNGTLPAHKAYLPVKTIDVPVVNAPMQIIFNDATGISQVENVQLSNENYYDLQGRKIENPTKGLYIVNGKKVVIK